MWLHSPSFNSEYIAKDRIIHKELIINKYVAYKFILLLTGQSIGFKAGDRIRLPDNNNKKSSSFNFTWFSKQFCC